MKIQRYLVFGGESFYASPGGLDFLFSSDSEEGAKEKAKRSIGKIGSRYNGGNFDEIKIGWSHVWDLKTRKIIHEFGDATYGSECSYIKYIE